MNTAPPPGTARVVTVWSVTGLILLLPTVGVAWIAVLSTYRGSHCPTYGEQCSTVPGEALHGCFWGSLAAGLVTLVWQRDR
jgi:hypothetical protein